MLELPYWLMIAGTLLMVSGFVGVLASGKKADEFDQLPNQPTKACLQSPDREERSDEVEEPSKAGIRR